MRGEAILLYGTNKMSTKDVLGYFALYGPSYLEWIDDASCNLLLKYFFISDAKAWVHSYRTLILDYQIVN